ncbi:MAG: hypothetical protein IJT16_10085 [Lachnospiraceae bacterium]|nr:hypothetical protein [Lachnospiraceae bacterium]
MKQKNAGTSLFLMEMIIIVLFFSVSSAVCVQAFVNSHLIDRKTQELNHAVYAAQSVAEVMKGTDGTIESLLSAYPEAKAAENGLSLYYNSEFKSCNGSDPHLSYLLEASLSREGTLETIQISVIKTEDQSEIYALTATKYRNGIIEETTE